MGAPTSSDCVEPEANGQRLTAANLVKVDLHAPAAEVSPYVTTFFRVRCDERSIRDIQPTSIGIVALMARGSGRMHFLDGRSEPSHRLLLTTPTSAAATFELDGPWDAFGAMLSPLGWASLTGLSAAEHANRLLDGTQFLPAPLVTAAREIMGAFDGLTADEMKADLSRAILASVQPVQPAHVTFIKTVADWLAQSLSPPLEDLVGRLVYSERQVQRLTERYFGLTPTRLARKYRALRAAVLLSRPGITSEEIAAIQNHFYDQSHMIREIRLFSGRTPARIADPDTPYLSSFMNLRDFSEPGTRMAPIPQDFSA